MDTVIVKEIIYKPIDIVWSFITELEHMQNWFFENIPSFEAKIGFKTEFNVVSDERTFLHSWEILEVTNYKLIKYNWRYPEYFDGNSYVTFYLNVIEDQQTEITIVSEGIDNYPDNIPEFTYESCKSGWEYFANRLVNYSKSIESK